MLRLRTAEPGYGTLGDASQVNQTDSSPDQTQNIELSSRLTHSAPTVSAPHIGGTDTGSDLSASCYASHGSRMRDDRQVNEGERHQRTKVNQAVAITRSKLIASKAIAPTRICSLPEYAISGVHNRRSFSGNAVTTHYVHQTRYACVRRHTDASTVMVEKISAPTWNALPAHTA